MAAPGLDRVPAGRGVAGRADGSSVHRRLSEWGETSCPHWFGLPRFDGCGCPRGVDCAFGERPGRRTGRRWRILAYRFDETNSLAVRGHAVEFGDGPARNTRAGEANWASGPSVAPPIGCGHRRRLGMLEESAGPGRITKRHPARSECTRAGRGSRPWTKLSFPAPLPLRPGARQHFADGLDHIPQSSFAPGEMGPQPHQVHRRGCRAQGWLSRQRPVH